jgi:tRNA1Val (adenine37-N6)-methyltransferase
LRIVLSGRDRRVPRIARLDTLKLSVPVARVDALFGGRVALHQPARGEGYRANVDALLLAAFAKGTRRAKLAYDLGAGAGAVALSLLQFDAAERVVMVEIDETPSEAARTNLFANGWAERGEVVQTDVRDLEPGAYRADLVVCNPPYVAPGRGRVSESGARARARNGDLGVFVRAARNVLGRRARACFVYPAHELGALWCALTAAGLEPKRLRTVHATDSSPARVVLVEARPAKPGGLVLEAPLVERSGGHYSSEVLAMLGGVVIPPPRASGPARSRTPSAR